MKNNYEDRFGYLIADVARLSGRVYDERVKSLGLTRAQSRVLTYLSWFGETNQARLAERLEVTPITLARLLDRMQEGGWIERVPVDGDRRAYTLQLTRRAREVFPKLLEVGDRLTDATLAGMSRPERDALIAVLQRIRSNLTGMLQGDKSS